MRKYEKIHIDYVRSIAPGKYNDEIAEMFNKKFNVNKSASAIRAMKGNHGIKSGKLPKRRRPAARLFTEEQEKFIRENAKGLYNNELADLVNYHFRLSMTARQMAIWKKNHNVTSGLTGHFEKGQKAWNKGMTGLVFEGSEKGWFKKGQEPVNYRPVGTERIDSKDGYVVMKVRDDGEWHERWKHKHVVVWEEAHGEVPDNHVVTFLDSDRSNVNIDNLMMISRRELVRMNQGNLFSTDPEMTRSGINLVKIQQRIGDLELYGGNKEEFNKTLERATRNGLNENTFIARLKRGWSLSDAVNKPLHSRKGA